MRPEGALPSGTRVLERAFYARDPRVVGPALLNKVLAVGDGRAGRIVEVEAYCGPEDPAAHSYRGMTARNATMFGPAGHLYVYFTYGLHHCCNAICGDVGEGVGVLIRALEPVRGVEAMRAERPRARRDADLCNGPGKLTQALGIDLRHDGADLVEGDRGIVIVDDGMAPPKRPVATPRIGIREAAELPWRWHVPAHAHVSKGPMAKVAAPTRRGSTRG